ncbi:AbrB family transcriptional regulator [Acidaminobacter sp.]|uniref:AbrB family transcriptional regulator n=1 Tax=Acidaminobacter sp. TaxID=1872102 RepID=UPI002560AEEE|nr:AbrB family transcriptional regulator [Acidaminobacter sp.]MDK9712286.1 AbrB family transcriptional regulator [Acidaminobacter sp.]
MKATANVRIIDELASETFKVYDNERKDGVEIFTEGDTINLRKFVSRCVICNAAMSTKEYKGKLMCQDCIDVIKEIAANDVDKYGRCKSDNSIWDRE